MRKRHIKRTGDSKPRNTMSKRKRQKNREEDKEKYLMCNIKAPQSRLYERWSNTFSPGILNMWFSNNANLLTKVTLSSSGLNNASAIAISNILTKNKDNLVITQLDLSKNKKMFDFIMISNPILAFTKLA